MKKIAYAVPALIIVAGLALTGGSELVAMLKGKTSEPELVTAPEPVRVRKPGAAVAGMEKNRSEVDQVDWYFPPGMSTENGFFAYIRDNETHTTLRVSIARTFRDSTLLLNGVVLASGGVRASASGGTPTTGVSGSIGTLWERADTYADPQMVSALKAVAETGSGSIKMTGHAGNEERPLLDLEIAMIRKTIEAYRELGGK